MSHQMAYVLIALLFLWLGPPAAVVAWAAWRSRRPYAPTPIPRPAPLPSLPSLNDVIAAASGEAAPPSSRPQGTQIGLGPNVLPPGNYYGKYHKE